RIWRKARDERRLSSTDLWELFRCHVVGSGGVGHTEHKGANTAVNLLGRFGARYTAAFLGFYESIVAFPASIGLHQFHSILLEATELLSSIVTGAQDGQYAVFNNAMFGPNIDMVEIFSNFRLAVVVRDPLDQYADRRAKDLKHWMHARRFVAFYRSSRKAFQQRKRELPAEYSKFVREVEFERFVLDTRYRDAVIEWMLQGAERRRTSRTFDPEGSKANIGIYRQVLTHDEADIIDRELRRWRRI